MQAVYYRAPDGSQPVDDAIDALPAASQAALDNQIGRLNMAGPDDPPLAFPHSSQIAGELRELRCRVGRRQYRVLYRRSRNLFVLLHLFEKTTRRVPPREIAIAEARWRDFENRMGASQRVPPRAAGADAP